MNQLIITTILSVFSLAITASGAYQEPDSLDLFENITDISRQIQQRTTVQEPLIIDEDSIIVVDPILLDTTTTTSDFPTDTIIKDTLVIDSLASDSLIIDSLNVDSLTLDTLKIDTIRPPLPKETKVLRGIDLIIKNELDSKYNRNENGTLRLPEYDNDLYALQGLSFRDTLFYNPLFLPVIYTGKILPRDLSFYSLEDDKSKGKLLSPNQTFEQNLEHSDFIQRVRRNYYSENPDRIRYSLLSFDGLPTVRSSDEVVAETFNPFRELLRTETTYSLEAPGVDLTTIRRKYWVRTGEHSFQFAQNYFSENWHKGGTNNLNFNSYNVFRANYNKDKIKFNNTLEWRLSVFNAPDDSIRQYRIGNDLLRYYGDFGVDAFLSGWSYSMNMEAKSQLFNAYPTNSNEIRSAFLAPLYVNAGIGLKYVLNKKSETVRHRNFKWDLAIAPVSINYRYVGHDSVSVVRYGIPEGKKSLLDLGTTITSIIKYNITRYVTWDSRLTYFTSYDKVITELENSLNMALSNAFSTRIYLNMRFDDSVPPDPTLNYWQINQTLSFGLNYKW